MAYKRAWFTKQMRKSLMHDRPWTEKVGACHDTLRTLNFYLNVGGKDRIIEECLHLANLATSIANHVENWK